MTGLLVVVCVLLVAREAVHFRDRRRSESDRARERLLTSNTHATQIREVQATYDAQRDREAGDRAVERAEHVRTLRHLAAEHTQHLLALQAEREREQREHRDQVQTLLNQIKPDTAQPVIPADVVSPSAVSMFDDDDHWAAANGLTKEQLADLAMAAEVNGGD